MKNKLEHYIEAAKCAKIGLWEIDLLTQEIYWDDVTRSIHEVGPDFVPNIENATDFYCEGKNRTKIKQLIENAIQNGIPFKETFEIRTSNNNTRFIENIGQIVYKQDKIINIRGTLQDITKEQSLINELHLNINKLYSIFSSTNDAILIIDATNGIITDCNCRLNNISGYSDAELIGNHKSILFPQKYKDEIKTFLHQHTDEGIYKVQDTFLKSKNGLLIPIEIASGKKFEIDNKFYLVSFFRDISERKKTEERMQMLLLAASKTTDSILIADAHGITVWANNAYLSLTGLTLEQIVGHKPGYLSKGKKTDVNTTNKMREAVLNKESFYTIILNYNQKKEEYWFELNITPIFDCENNLLNFIGIGRDVTLRKEKEIELKRLLDLTIDQNNRLLNYSHIVSHNIRSHSSNLTMLMDVIENEEDPNEKIKYLSMFKGATEKLEETIKYLNEIISIQQNSNVKKTKIFLKEEIDKTQNALSLTIKKSKISIINNIPDDLVVRVIPAYLDSILLNLISNAIKYKSKNRKSFLKISHVIEGAFTIISFEDNGLGINLEKDGKKVFGMYKTFHGNNDALGIGLFITKNQIEAMGGKIEVESTEGVGSTFKIYLSEK
ncbi:PAS domain S-box protein [Flavobacterium sp. IMCC34518]|uniref:PAS domain-containing sensor histidine kinase n=1 Tax=Flavobacterium sp. IMCC34518 TaxID=3003623 RepID=UPI002482C51B|nr:PAS domain S-box protein [Flavobacterium sp. IMCC34518]